MYKQLNFTKNTIFYNYEGIWYKQFYKYRFFVIFSPIQKMYYSHCIWCDEMHANNIQN